MIGRREFITLLGGAGAWPLAARAEKATMPVVGVLIGSTVEGQLAQLAGLRQGLKESGFVEGQDVGIEYRSAEGQPDRLPALAAELVRRPVNVLVTIGGTVSALAAKSATSSVPIVFLIGADPVELGLVASLNRPGGNITGMGFLVNKLVAKRLGLLSELVPGAATLGMLVDPNNPNADADTRDARTAADALGRKLLFVEAGTKSEVDTAYATLVQQRVSALFVAAHANFNNWRHELVALAARHAVAASYSIREYVAIGGLTSYGPNTTDVYRHAGVYVGRILRGAKPADLPVLQPTKFELAINLKTANALGLVVPNSMQLLADEVIE